MDKNIFNQIKLIKMTEQGKTGHAHIDTGTHLSITYNFHVLKFRETLREGTEDARERETSEGAWTPANTHTHIHSHTHKIPGSFQSSDPMVFKKN